MVGGWIQRGFLFVTMIAKDDSTLDKNRQRRESSWPPWICHPITTETRAKASEVEGVAYIV